MTWITECKYSSGGHRAKLLILQKPLASATPDQSPERTVTSRSISLESQVKSAFERKRLFTLSLLITAFWLNEPVLAGGAENDANSQPHTEKPFEMDRASSSELCPNLLETANNIANFGELLIEPDLTWPNTVALNWTWLDVNANRSMIIDSIYQDYCEKQGAKHGQTPKKIAECRSYRVSILEKSLLRDAQLFSAEMDVDLDGRSETIYRLISNVKSPNTTRDWISIRKNGLIFINYQKNQMLSEWFARNTNSVNQAFIHKGRTIFFGQGSDYYFLMEIYRPGGVGNAKIGKNCIVRRRRE